MRDVEYCVMEASSHALYLDRVYGVPFTAGIFTNLTQDHLDFHDSLESYLEAKKILFKSLKVNGFAVINIDDPASESILKDYQGNYVTYGIHDACDFRAENNCNGFIWNKIYIKLQRTGINRSFKVDW